MNRLKNKVPVLLMLILLIGLFSLSMDGAAEQSDKSVDKSTTQQEKNQPDSLKSNSASNGEEQTTGDGARPEPVKDKEQIKGQSLFQTVSKGGPLMIFLILMGVISLAIIIERFIFFTRNNVWTNIHMENHLRAFSEKSNVRFREDHEDELRGVFQIYSNKLERGLTLLSGLGNLAPVVGFLGTVIGMIGAFSDIMEAASVNAKVVANGIKVALVTTAGGLVVAAPALAAFYFFMHIIQQRYARAEEVISELGEKYPRLTDEISKESTSE